MCLPLQVWIHFSEKNKKQQTSTVAFRVYDEIRCGYATFFYFYCFCSILSTCGKIQFLYANFCSRRTLPLLISLNLFQAKPGMDGYLHQQEVANPKQPLFPQPPFAEDFAPPYSVNMSLLLPDVSYLHPGLCRAMRGIKREAAHNPLPHGTCQENGAPPLALPDYPGGFGDSNFLIKQEAVDYPEVPLFQLLNSDLEHLVQGPQLNSVPVTCLSPPAGNLHCSKAPGGPQGDCYQLTGRQQRPQHLPPSPPQSTASSPGRGIEQLSRNLSPPPSYEATIASKLHFRIHDLTDPGQTCTAAPAQGSAVGLVQGSGRSTLTPVQTAAHVGPRSPVLAQSALFKSSRKNNPDLERRRIHHCDVPGESRLYF